MQSGGIIKRPTTVLAGEVPEAFVPLRSGAIPVEMSGGGLTVNVTNNMGGTAEIGVQENTDERTLNLVVNAMNTYGPMRRAMGHSRG